MAKRIVDEEMRFSIIVNGNKAQKELFELEKSTRNLTQKNKDLRAERARLVSQGKKDSNAYRELSAEIRKNNTVIKSNKARMSELQKEIGITGLTIGQLRNKATQLRLALKNMIPGSSDYKRYIKDLKEVTAQMDKLRAQSRVTKLSISSIANGFNKYAAMGASVVASLTGVVLGAQKLIDFNGKLADAQSDVQKTTGMTKREVDELTKSFGVLQTRTSRINLLKIAEEGGRIGIAKEEISDFVKVMDKAVVALSDSFPGGVEEVASKLGKLKLLFKETKDQKVDVAYESIGSAINDLGANGVATESNIANFATRVGSLPDAIKPTIGQALALGAGFEESGIQAEIASRAYNIFLKQASQESEKFAKVMGISNEEVERMVNEDALEFMITFAKGLKGMNATDTARTLDFLGVSADGANKIMGALSNNTDRFRTLLELSNRSMRDGSSLTNEFNVKNNNLQATLEKIRKTLNGMIAVPFGRWLENAANFLAEILGVNDDVTESFYEQTQAMVNNARQNRALAESSQNLLDEYEDLKEKGVDPTTEAKNRLDEITLQLKDRLGDSVIEINKETGAFELNTEAVRNQIKLKRLAADEEAATLASRLKGIEEEKKRLQSTLPSLKQEADARQRLADKRRSGGGTMVDIITGLPIAPGQKGTTEEDAKALAAALKLGQAKTKITEQEAKRLDILKKLKDLNFSEEDVDLLFKDIVVPPNNDPKRDPFNVPKEGGEKQRKGLLDFQRETEDARLAIIGDAFKRELETQRVHHLRKIEDLQSQKRTEGENAVAINSEINKQIELENEIHELKNAEIIERGLKESIEKYKEAHELEKDRRETAFNEEYARLGNDEKAKLALREQFQKERLELETEYLNEILGYIDQIKARSDFGGLDFSILTPEQVAEFEALADRLKLQLSELGVAKNNLSKANSAGQAQDALEKSFGSTDILGFSIDQWTQTFDSLDTLSEKIMAAELVVGSLMGAWGMYHDFVSKKSQAELREFERSQDEKRQALERQLESGAISQKQYDQANRAIEEESRKRRAEAEYKQAKREKEMAIAGIALNTAIGVSKALAQGGFILGVPWAAVIGALGAVQTAIALATPLPAKGYEEGYYGDMPVKREQDGRVFNASYGGKPTTQLVDRPKMFLAGEGGKDFPEMIIDGRSFRRFRPDFKEALYREVARAKGYEGGYYKENGTSETDAMMLSMLQHNIELMTYLKENGIVAVLPRTMGTAKAFAEDYDQYLKFKKKRKQ